MTGTLLRLSLTIADALESGDLDTAECLIGERGRLLDGTGSRAVATPLDGTGSRAVATPVPASNRPVPASAHPLLQSSDPTARGIADAEARSVAALTGAMAETHRELRELAVGARAARGYLAEAPVAPGYVDSRD